MWEQVGLSGSSAIIIAAFRALMKFHSLTLADLRISIDGKWATPVASCSYANRILLVPPYFFVFTAIDFPGIILDIERIELKINAGLQDRVIQTYGGLVHMDFSPLAMGHKRGLYTPLDSALLPPLYLAYDAHTGSDSGTAHSTVKDRWIAGYACTTEGDIFIFFFCLSFLLCE